MTTANVHTFDIPSENLSTLDTKLKRLAKRADKLGLGELVKWTRGETFSVTKKLSSGRKRVIDFTKVELTIAGDVLLPGGWHLVAALNHDSGTDTPIILAVPGEELPVEYRTSGPDCNHCKFNRRRKDTFVIRDSEGEYKQVGRTCIADYLGHKDALAIAQSCASLFQFVVAIGDPEDGFYNSRPATIWELDDCLAFVAAIVRLDGWAPKSNPVGTPTADVAWSWFVRDFEPVKTKTGTINPPDVLDSDVELAGKAIAWLLEKDPSKGSDYIYNVQTIARGGRVTTKTIGLAASIIGSYKRDVERQLRYAAERKAKSNGHVSEFVGEPKERLRKLNITVLGTFETEGNYGLSTRVTFQDEHHNDFVWFASGSVELEQGESYIVDATVKKHNEFRGNKQTQVNRVRVVG